MICKDCKYKVITRQRHNGNRREIREYFYCNKIGVDDYEMENMVNCSEYENEKRK